MIEIEHGKEDHFFLHYSHIRLCSGQIVKYFAQILFNWNFFLLEALLSLVVKRVVFELKLKQAFVIGVWTWAFFFKGFEGTHLSFHFMRYFWVFAGYWLRVTFIFTERDGYFIDFLFFLLNFVKINASLIQFSFDGGIPVILNAVISSPRKELRYYCPFVAINIMGCQQCQVFFLIPFLLVDVWVQVVMPSFSALLSNSILEISSYLGPISGTILFH